MKPLVRRALAAWAQQPHGLGVATLMGAVVSFGAGERAVALALWVVAVASLTQGLRSGWRHSRLVTGLVAAMVVPTAVLTHAASGWIPASILGASIPASLVLSVILTRWRDSRGAPLWLDGPGPVEPGAPGSADETPPLSGQPGDAPQPAVPAERSWLARNRSGCIIILVLFFSCTGWSLLRLAQPARDASATQRALHPGMTAREVLVAANGSFHATLSSESDTLLRVITWDGERIALEDPQGGPRVVVDHAGLGAALDARAEVLARCRRIGFTFTTLGVPPRVSFTVQMDDEGRMRAVGPSHNWD